MLFDLLLLLVGRDTAYNIARKLQYYYTNSKEIIRTKSNELRAKLSFFFLLSNGYNL